MYYLYQSSLLKMKQLLSRISGKRLVVTTLCQMCTVTEDVDITKPEGWETAKPYHSIPGPKGLPFLGNKWRFLPYVGDLHGYDLLRMVKLFNKKHGKIAVLSGVSIADMVILYDPEDIEWVFRNEGIYPVRDATSKSSLYYRQNVRPEVFQGILGISHVHGKEWHHVRSKVNPILMQPKTVLQYASHMELIAKELVDKMRHLANSSSLREMPEDFHKCLYSWSLESILFICLNKQIGCLDQHISTNSESSKIISAIHEIFALFYKIELQPSIRNIYKTKTWKRYVEQQDIVTSIFLKYLEEAISKMENKTDQSPEETTILQQLLKVDKQLAIAVTLDLLTGGVDTTAKVAGSALYYLAKTPKAQNELRAELFTLLPNKDSPVTKEVLSNAPYLRSVIKETTRLASASALNVRQSVKDMVIAGYQVPKGTNIYTANLLLSQSEDNYKHAKEFIPERWLRSTSGELSAKSLNPFITLPFGFGPRICLGKRLSTLELEILIAKVVRNFYLKWHYKDAEFHMTPFYGLKDPLRLRIHEV